MLPTQSLFRNISIPTAIVFHLLIFGPLLLQIVFFDRSSKGYQVCWQWLVRILAFVSLGTFFYVMWVPYYSQVPHPTANPGGPAGDLFSDMRFLLFLTSVVVPSFPILVLLSLFPPTSSNSKKQLAIKTIVPLGVALLALVILLKQHAYREDYHDYRKTLQSVGRNER